MLPFSFAEFVDRRRNSPGTGTDLALSRLYSEYIQFGSFPYVTGLIPDLNTTKDYLDGIINTVLLKDVTVRQRVSNTAMLSDVVSFFAHNIGNLTSMRRIAASLSHVGRPPSPTTVENYLTGLIDAFLFYPVKRWNIAGLRHLEGPEKYYIVDPGMRYSLVGYAGGDTGRVLENVVYLELCRRHKHVKTGQSNAGEIDFIVGQGNDMSYIQVSETVRDPVTLTRELKPLQTLKNHYPKYLLTLDENPPISHNGIQQINCLDWLVDPNYR
jgi:predicted AAA+ superfamily ATPase